MIAGCPGSGKTTLAHTLAARTRRGVHIVTDDFFGYLSHPLDPSTPASHKQNTTVVHAYLAAARQYAAEGDEGFLDGVIGPWWLDTIAAQLPGFGYVLLHADLETVIQRTRNRAAVSQASAHPQLVRTMHEQFANVLQAHTSRAINTTHSTPAAVVEEFLQRRRKGDFAQPD